MLANILRIELRDVQRNNMNFFYEELPNTVNVKGENVKIITDFREYIRLLDMLKDQELDTLQKFAIIQQYFLDGIVADEEAISALSCFITMDTNCVEVAETGDCGRPQEKPKKNLFSYSIDYPYILSGFLRDYGIDLIDIKYMHWWKFRMLFDGLSDDTEIKQRIMYRSVDLSEIKDKEERKRIKKIQKSIQLPSESLTDYDIGNAFM